MAATRWHGSRPSVAPRRWRPLQRYLEEHASKKRLSSQSDDASMIRAFVLPAFAHKKVTEVTFSDCDGLHRKITSRGTKHRANRVIALLSKAFNLSIRWGWRPDNPCKGIERNPEGKRTRYLSADELARLTAALAKYDDQQAANIIRLLLLTGARRGEVLGARWADLDLETGVWTKPGATTKQKTEHRVPLSAPALAIADGNCALRRPTMPNSSFPGRHGGHRFDTQEALAEDLQGRRHHWPPPARSSALLREHVGERRLLAADDRRAARTLAAGTTARYAHLFDDPLRAATNRVGAIIAGKAPAKVVRLRGGR